jgi:hypothetical protein
MRSLMVGSCNRSQRPQRNALHRDHWGYVGFSLNHTTP